MNDICEMPEPHDAVINELKEEMPEPVYFEKSVLLFKSLSDLTRARIIWALDRKKLCVCDLSVLLGMTQSAVSHQLAGLRTAGMVRSRKSGKEVFYTLADDHIRLMLESGMEHAKE